MANYHIVKQGEHVSGIAGEYGFRGYQTIWDHPENGGLKQKRIDPNVLFPGDLLFVPDLQTREESCCTEKRHTFVLHAPALTLRLVLEDVYGKPIANAPCDLILESKSTQPVTDAGGRIEQTIPSGSHNGLLVVRDEQSPAAGERIPVLIGDLDPVEEVSGQKARLSNLGYLVATAIGNDEYDLRSSIEEFQCDHPPLKIDGICGPKTQAALKRAHGC